MTREDFRRELGDAFESISGSPSPALPDRVRAALVEAPEHGDRVWIAALAAAVITVVLVGVLLVSNPLNLSLISGGPGKHTPGVSPGPATTPSPSPSPNPTPTPQYICGASMTFSGNGGLVDALRTGTHARYDRLTIEFDQGLPQSIELRPQTGTNFTRDGIGDTVKLAGNYGLLISMFSTDAHTKYSGSMDIKTGYTGLLEVRIVGDYEGYVHVGLGLSKPACYHATILTNPTRLVIDIQVG